MSENILVCTAWPYANGDLHIGHLAGAYLPPDIFARFHRLKGNNVLMVSGSDSHGTPITMRADAEGVTPLEVFERFHLHFLDTFQQIGITYDLFTHTDTENHHRIAQDIFTACLNNGYLYSKAEQQFYFVCIPLTAGLDHPAKQFVLEFHTIDEIMNCFVDIFDFYGSGSYFQ